MDLRSFPTFADVGEQELADFVGACVSVSLEPGEVLVEAGSEAHTLYLVTRGKVRVTVNSDRGDQELATLSAPCVIGEVEFLCGRPNSATVRAVEPAFAVAVPFEVLRHRLESGDEVARRAVWDLARVLATRLSDLGQRVTEIIREGAHPAASELQLLKQKLFTEWTV